MRSFIWCGAVIGLLGCGGASIPKSTEAEVRGWGLEQGVGGRIHFRSGDCTPGNLLAQCSESAVVGSVVLLPVETANDGTLRNCAFVPGAGVSSAESDNFDHDLSANNGARFAAPIGVDGTYSVSVDAGSYVLFISDSSFCATRPAERGAVVPTPIVVGAGDVRVVDVVLNYSTQ